MNSPFIVAGSPQVDCVNDPGGAVTQVVVQGRWDGLLREEASWVLRACVAEAPFLVLVDLTQLQDPAGESGSTWRTAARYAAEADPPVSVVLCAVPTAVRQRLSSRGGDQAIGLADSVETARAAVRGPDGTFRRRHMALLAQPAASALARTMVGDACLALGAAHLTYPARLIVSELVANAVSHTGTDPEMWVSVRGDMLHLAVQDGSRELPRLLDLSPGRWRPSELQQGWGLRAVTAAATAWGALPCRRGKVVWAALAIRAGAPT
ncbi:ATP-binding protein [Actinoplanes aureus]|uniref:ATP-binding protein n=1 Tax=Actinoplanes aureus TaxID=2792083 RepID=A0A931CE35_9ACTN|nr:ATP-binding protein [Actinoplanes aureus]MBG0568205.1 ATP-binding protein [Actinoplanes aureus]